MGTLNRELLLYKQLSKKNVQFTFLTYGDKSELEYTTSLKDLAILPVERAISSRNRTLRFLKSLLLPIKLRNEFKNVDIIKTNQVEGNWVAYLAKLIFRKKLVVRGGFEKFRNYISSYQLKKNQKYLRYLFQYLKLYILEYIAYKIADVIILTSDSDIDFIIKMFRLRKQKDKIYHISNFIDINLFKPLNLEKKEKSVLFIGRFHPVKNIDNLIKAFSELNDFNLTMIGEGSPFESYIEDYKDDDLNIDYIGVVPNNELPKIINQHQIFILPSYYEGTPKTLLAAMSSGSACIGTDVRGINNIIEHKANGYLCKTDAMSIKNAILNLYNNKDLRVKISNAARDYVIENCSIDSITQKEYLIYKLLLKKN